MGDSACNMAYPAVGGFKVLVEEMYAAMDVCDEDACIGRCYG